LGKAGYDHEGNIVSVIGTIRDITELRDATGKPKLPGELPLKKSGGAGSGCYGSKDRELTKHKRLEEALSESEQCFSALCDHAPIGIFRTDWEGNNIYSNAIWEEITGQSAAAAKGKGWLNAIHPDDGDRFGKAWFKAMVTGRPYSLEHRIITPQGETVWVRSGASNIKGANGQIRGFVGTVENLSTLKQTALQLAPTVSAPDLLAVQTPPIAAKNDSVSFSLSESP
jgi:PAS domain S-box-containing protein